MSISKRIAEARNAAHLTQKDVADVLGVSVQAVSQWENGKSAVSPARIRSLSEMLQVSEDWLSGKSVDHVPIDPAIYDRDSLLNRMIDVIDLTDVINFVSRDKTDNKVMTGTPLEDHSGIIVLRDEGFGIYVSTPDAYEEQNHTTEFWVFDTGVIPEDGDIVIVAIPKNPVFHLKSLGSEVDVRLAFRRFKRQTDADSYSSVLEPVNEEGAGDPHEPALILATRIERRIFRKASVAEDVNLGA